MIQKNILALRERIDSVDDQILKLLNERSSLALEIGKIKKTNNLAVYDPERETQILKRLQSQNTGPLENNAVVRLFERIIDEARRLERIKATEE